MDRMLYVAMSGAKQTMLAQAVNTNNLANVNTTGFRADLEAFRSLPVYGPGYPSRVYAQTETPGTDLLAGTLSTTGRELDVAVNGAGWIAVQAADGSEAYTRAGDLRVTVNGQLETGAGRPVMGNGGPIAVPPFEKLEIGADGTISIRPVGQAANALAVVDRIKLVNPPLGQMEKGTDGLMRVKDGKNAAADAAVQLASGVLESSNVNAIEAMVRMIELGRQFETQIKMMRAAQENDAASAQLMRMG
ncbi:MAG: flagellar basal-body rod protein FlgF [Gammaproteobacteria bacterium]|jgi:flagellar basal-body rod protein FlgF|nr:flagellar basal-body rod protein FlgF [Gammaproteobacteria bacterium]